jgi:PPOX class probable FMN-dependent enzyme
MGEIKSVQELQELYGQVSEIAAQKERPSLDIHTTRFIGLSPFAILATADACGNCDVSPRGDAPGFVRVVNSTQIQMPDRTGNNRADSNRNIVENSNAALIFLVPGLGETLRIRGATRIRTDPNLCATFESHGKIPRAVLEMDIQRVFFQCQKALIRSDLWNLDTHVDRNASGIPSLGAIFADQIDGLEAERAEELIGTSYKKHMW